MRALPIALLLLLAAPAWGQGSTWPGDRVSMDSGNDLQADVDSGEVAVGSHQFGAGPPTTETCANAGSDRYTDTTNDAEYYCFATDTWTAYAAGGSPGGTEGQVQVNASGSFGGVAEGTATQVLTSNGAGLAPTFQDAAGGGATNIGGEAEAYFLANAPFPGNIAPEQVPTTFYISPDPGGHLPQGYDSLCDGGDRDQLGCHAGDSTCTGGGTCTLPNTRGDMAVPFRSESAAKQWGFEQQRCGVQVLYDDLDKIQMLGIGDSTLGTRGEGWSRGNGTPEPGVDCGDNYKLGLVLRPFDPTGTIKVDFGWKRVSDGAQVTGFAGSPGSSTILVDQTDVAPGWTVDELVGGKVLAIDRAGGCALSEGEARAITGNTANQISTDAFSADLDNCEFYVVAGGKVGQVFGSSGDHYGFKNFPANTDGGAVLMIGFEIRNAWANNTFSCTDKAGGADLTWGSNSCGCWRTAIIGDIDSANFGLHYHFNAGSTDYMFGCSAVGVSRSIVNTSGEFLDVGGRYEMWIDRIEAGFVTTSGLQTLLLDTTIKGTNPSPTVTNDRHGFNRLSSNYNQYDGLAVDTTLARVLISSAATNSMRHCLWWDQLDKPTAAFGPGFMRMLYTSFYGCDWGIGMQRTIGQSIKTWYGREIALDQTGALQFSLALEDQTFDIRDTIHNDTGTNIWSLGAAGSFSTLAAAQAELATSCVPGINCTCVGGDCSAAFFGNSTDMGANDMSENAGLRTRSGVCHVDNTQCAEAGTDTIDFTVDAMLATPAWALPPINGQPHIVTRWVLNQDPPYRRGR